MTNPRIPKPASSGTAAARHPLSRFDLEGKVVVVTGASSGIGRQFATVLDACGAKLVLGARREPLLVEQASACRDAMAVPTDLTDEAAVVALVEKALETFGRIDVLINTAGASYAKPALRDDLDAVKQLIELDLVAPYHLAVLAARSMKDGDVAGSIINVASVGGLLATTGIPMAAYSAAKGGLVNLTRDLATQWGRYGIRVNTLAPGWFDLGMGKRATAEASMREWIEARIALHRLGREDELDGAMMFLASDASSFVTGQTIVVDGGWSAV